MGIFKTDRRIHSGYNVVRVNEKQIFIDGDGSILQRNISQVIPERTCSGKNQFSVTRNALKIVPSTTTNDGSSQEQTPSLSKSRKLYYR